MLCRNVERSALEHSTCSEDSKVSQYPKSSRNQRHLLYRSIIYLLGYSKYGFSSQYVVICFLLPYLSIRSHLYNLEAPSVVLLLSICGFASGSTTTPNSLVSFVVAALAAMNDSSPENLHPLSSPPLRKLQSPFNLHSHPPPTPAPFFQAMRGISSPSFHAGTSLCASKLFRENFERPQVKGLKSCSSIFSGILPVSALPIARMEAAWEHIMIALTPSSSERFMIAWRA